MTWRKLIIAEMQVHGETWDDIIKYVPEYLRLDRRFDAGFGCIEGKPFTLWTKKRVYFPTDYDGAEDADSVPRDPCDEVTEHFGGGG